MVEVIARGQMQQTFTRHDCYILADCTVRCRRRRESADVSGATALHQVRGQRCDGTRHSQPTGGAPQRMVNGWGPHFFTRHVSSPAPAHAHNRHTHTETQCDTLHRTSPSPTDLARTPGSTLSGLVSTDFRSRRPTSARSASVARTAAPTRPRARRARVRRVRLERNRLVHGVSA